MPNPISRRAPALAFAFAALLFAGSISISVGQTPITWSSTSDTDFSDGANWTGGVAPADNPSINSAAFTGIGTANPVLTTSQTVQGLSFTGGDYTFSASGGAVLTLGNGGITKTFSGGNATVSVDLIMSSHLGWSSAGIGKWLTLSGDISGNFSPTAQAQGNLLLSGTNTYTGATTIDYNGGIMQFAKTASLYNGDTASWTAANLNVGGGNFGTTYTGSGTVAFNVGGTGEFSAGNVTTLLTNLSTVSNNGLKSGASIGFDTSNAAGGTFTVADLIADSTGTGGGTVGFMKLGTGTLVLSGANTYTGNTFIFGGTLQLSGSGTLGSSTSAALVITDGTLDLNSATQTKGSVTLSGTSSIESTGGGGSLSGTSFDLQNDGTISATLAGTGGITKSTTGTVVLSGTNTFTGKTTINDGTLSVNSLANLGVASALGAPTTIADGTIALGLSRNEGTLIYTGPTASTDRVIDLTGGRRGAATLDSSGTGPITFTSDFTATGDGTKTFTLTGTTAGNTIAGAIVDSSSATSLTKAGEGSWILSGTNTYTGATTVSAGTLVVDGSASGSAFTVDGGILSGSGTVGALTIASGGTLAPGNSPGTLTVDGNSVWAGGGTLEWEVNDATGAAGTATDLLSITGGLTITATSGNRFTINLLSLNESDESGTVINFDSAASYAYTIASTTAGVAGFSADAFSLNTTGFTNAFNGTWALTQDGNNLNLIYTASAVPEPGTYALFVSLAGLGLAFSRTRHRRSTQ